MSSIFKIFSKEDCDFYYDGELQGHIIGNSDKAFALKLKGKARIVLDLSTLYIKVK